MNSSTNSCREHSNAVNREALEAAGGSDILEREGAAPAVPAKTNARRTPAVSAVPALPDAGLKSPQRSHEPEARRTGPNDTQTLRLM